MANDGKILNELYSLSWRIEELERKLETSLTLQENLAANLLDDSSSVSAASAMAIKKLDKGRISDSSCSEPFSSEDEQQSPRFIAANFDDLEPEKERTYLIIPVGSYKEKGSFSFPMENPQTFTWSEMDGNPQEYISSNELVNGDEEIVQDRDGNEMRLRKLNNYNTQDVFVDKSTNLCQSRFCESEKHTSVKGNGDESELIPLEDCLISSREPLCNNAENACLFEGQGRIGGAFDIDYDEDQLNITDKTNEIKNDAMLNADKYGLTISIASLKCLSDSIVHNDTNSLREPDTPNNQHLEHSGRFSSHFREDDRGKKLLYVDPTSQTSSVEITFDQVCHHSSKSMYYDNSITKTKQRSTDFASHTNTDGNQPLYKVCYVDSESSKDDVVNYNPADTCLRDKLSNENNSMPSNVNLNRQLLLANTAPDSKEPTLVYPQLVSNGTFGNGVHLTKTTELLQKGNHGFELNETVEANTRLLDMQIQRVPKEQRHEDTKYMPPHNCLDAKRFIAHKTTNEGHQRETCTKDIERNLNSNGEASIDVSCELHETKLSPFRLVGGHISQFGYHVYEILGKNNNYTVISISRKSNNHAANSLSASVNPSDEGILRNPDVLACGSQKSSTLNFEFKSSETQSLADYSDHESLCNEFGHAYGGDISAERGFSKNAVSCRSEPTLLASTQRRYSELEIRLLDVSESESLYSSLTSFSSDEEVRRQWELDNGSSSYPYGQERERRIYPNYGESPKDRTHYRNADVLYNRDDMKSSSGNNTSIQTFKLSPLSGFLHTPSGLEYTLNDIRVSSPTSSTDVSDFQTSGSTCGCQFQCECQTGITSAVDFREELKVISNSVFSGQKESISAVRTSQKTYFLDEEQGDMVMFYGHLDRENEESKAVSVLVRMILRIRNHFFENNETRTQCNSKHGQDANNNEMDLLSGQLAGKASTGKQRNRKISFSPSAVLLSAIGENSTLELKEVIEKENIDVNQLSPSGRSLLHKAAVVGDLDSIQTLVQYGALVNLQDREGFPPIHSALAKANFECIVMLIECGTDLTRYTNERVREFLEIKNMAKGHFPVLRKTLL